MALASTVVASACGQREPTDAPSVLLVTLDTTRADALGCYGNPAAITPNLDALAKESVLYEAARTVAPLTLPAHASMLTGLYPPRHGIADNGFRPLPRSAETVAELAREAGVQTAAFVAAIVLDPAFGLAQGFDTYEAPQRVGAAAANRVVDLPASAIVDRALAWFEERDRSRPYFAWVHVFDAHAPYEPTPQLRERARGSAYLGEIAAIDQALGRLFDTLREQGDLEHATVIVVADHGESLGQHGEATHGAFAYDATLRVPLLVRHPDGARAGERSSELASVVDVCPTALAALGLAIPPALDGVDLARPVPPERGLYFESYEAYLGFGCSPLAGWLDAEGKYLHSSKPEFYEPRNDPREKRDLIGERAATAARHRDAIAAVWAMPVLEADRERVSDSALLEELRELGYTALEAPSHRLPNPLESRGRPSPAEASEVMREFWAASDSAYRGDYDAAIVALSALAARQPDSVLIRSSLADHLIQRGRTVEAEPILARLVEDGVERANVFNSLGWCRERAGDLDAARINYARALELDPGHPNARENLDRLRSAPGR